MNSADIIAIVIIVVFTALGALLGFTRGLFGFLGVFFGAKMAASATAAMTAANAAAAAGGGAKYLQVFAGIAVAGFVVGFLFYGATKFTPMDAMEPVFGAIFGLLIGWGIAYAVFHYYLFFNNTTKFAVDVYNGNIAMAVHNVAPWQAFMNKMDRFKNPNLD